MTAQLKLPQYPDQTFAAMIATTSDAIWQGSRSLLVELRRENKDNLLQPGAFVEVDFNLPLTRTLLEFRQVRRSFVGETPKSRPVNADNKVVLKPVVVGAT